MTTDTDPEPKPKLKFDRRAMKRIRLECQLSHPDLARALGISPTGKLTYYWEAGWTHPTVDSVGRLALALECEPLDLLEWSTDATTARERLVAAAERDAAEG